MEARVKDGIEKFEDGIDEVKAKLHQSEIERKKLIEKIEMTMTEHRKFKEDFTSVKDEIRRQQASAHLELKQELLSFHSHCESLISDINLAKNSTAQQQIDLTQAYTRIDLVNNMIVKVENRVQELEEDHMTKA